MTNWSTVPCVEVHGTRRVGRNWKEGPKCSVVLQTDYAKRYLLSEDLFLNGYWPFTPSGEAAPRVQDIDIEFLPTEYEEDGQTIIYKEVRLHVEYYFDDSAGDDSGGGGGGGTGRQLYTEVIEPSSEIRSFSEHEFSFADQNGKFHSLPENNLPNVRFNKMSVVRTFFNWIFVPTTFLSLQNTVNDAPVTMLGMTFPPETLLFSPRSAQRSLSTEGTKGYTVQVAFIYDFGGWNKFPIPDPVTGLVEEKELFIRDLNPAAQRKVFKPYLVDDFSDWVF